MLSTLVSGASGLGSSPGRGHCVVFLGKTLYSHSVSVSAQVYTSKWVPANLMLGVTLRWKSITSGGGGGGRRRNTPGHFMSQELG